MAIDARAIMPHERDRIVSAGATREDEAIEASIRPKRLDEYLGQQPVREQMKIYIEAAKRARRGARPRADLRPARPGQDHARARHRQRAGRQPAPDLRPGDREGRRPGRAADQPAAARRAVHRRDPPPLAGGRGSPVSGDGGLPDRHHDRRGPRGALDQARPAAVHPDRRDHARRPADRAAARPLRHRAAPGVLQRRRS